MSYACVLVCWRSGGSTLYRHFDAAGVCPLDFARDMSSGAVYIAVMWDGCELEWQAP